MSVRNPAVRGEHQRTPTLSVLILLSAGLVLGVPSGVAAFTIFDEAETPRYTLTFCVESAPASVGVTQARVLLANAIDSWHAAPDQDDSQALSLSQDSTLPCDAGAIQIFGVCCGGTEFAKTNNGAGTIQFYGDEWWDGIGTRGPTEVSYEGILTHEIGHTFGLHHSGDANWSYDGAFPTMSECGTEAESVLLAGLAQDDWGGAAYVRGGARWYWNANPGFEKDFSHWGISGSVTAGAGYAVTGARGARMPASGNFVYMTSVYDPWLSAFSVNPPDQIESPGMDTSSALLHVFGYYRHPSTGTTGGVSAQYNRRFIQYNGTDPLVCKSDGFITPTSWSGVITLGPSCGDPGTTWTQCDRTIVIDNSLTNDATVFRVFMTSTSSSYVYIDKVGPYGGTTP